MRKLGPEVAQSAKAVRKLRRAVAECKERLSSTMTSAVAIESLFDGADFMLSVTRSRLAMLAFDVLGQYGSAIPSHPGFARRSRACCERAPAISPTARRSSSSADGGDCPGFLMQLGNARRPGGAQDVRRPARPRAGVFPAGIGGGGGGSERAGAVPRRVPM